MESKGYKVNWTDTRKYITFTPPKGKSIRNSNLEETFKEKRFGKENMENGIRKHSAKGEFGEIEKRLREVEQAVNGNVRNSQQEDRTVTEEQRNGKSKLFERNFELKGYNRHKI